MNLFSNQDSSIEGNSRARIPLADRMRPKCLGDFVGQENLVGVGKPLQRALESGRVTSLILWGPPGTGKTTLARIIAKTAQMDFVLFSAVLSGIKEIKSVMRDAEKIRQSGRQVLLFVDEIHRFNKAQQDAFLPYVESGTIVLIGATTENPSFEVNAALLSRCKVYLLEPISHQNLVALMNKCLSDKQQGLGNEQVEIDQEHLSKISLFANGDARVAYNTLEIATQIALPLPSGQKQITNQILKDAMQQRVLLYDKTGEEHYNLISALHKSLRNSDPDASLYWLMRMLESGEDPLFIARRLIRFALEDIGLADPQALVIAVQAKEAFHFIGSPEGNLALAQAAIYLATVPKSNALYKACNKVLKDIKNSLVEPVPLHLRNAPTRLMESFGYSRDYQYAHDFPDQITDMCCMPESLKHQEYFHPSQKGYEKIINDRMKVWRDKIVKIKKNKQSES
jgi:putative ATPase